MANSLEKEFKKLESFRVSSSPAKNRKSTVAGITQSTMQAMMAAGYSIAEPKNVTNMQRGVATAITRRFINHMNTLALSGRRSYWHLYESEKFGQTPYRLFNLVVADNQYKSNMRIDAVLLPAKMLTHVNPYLATPGKSGKYVKKRHKFATKAFAAEYGKKITIKPKPGNKKKVLVFAKGGKLFFTKKPIKYDLSKYPAFMAFSTAAASFFEFYAGDIATSYYDRQNLAAKQNASRAALANVKVNVPSASRARAAARSIARGSARL